MLASLLLSLSILSMVATGDNLITRVNVFHLIDNELWGEVDGSFLQGNFPCGNIECNFFSSDTKTNLLRTLIQKFQKFHHYPALSVSLYNIHSWKPISAYPHKPDRFGLPTNFTLAESEESHSRFRYLFDSSFPHFDGYSTTSPASSVPRTYVSALNTSEFMPMKSHSTLIPGASFVASTCHRGRGTTKREAVVEALAKNIRVDSLGKCMQSQPNQEGIALGVGSTAQESLHLKQQALANYMFYFAFENSYEPGYVTEKVFDALYAGVIPVYLGPSADCRRLLPTPTAAIFIDDFEGDLDKVSKYLRTLIANETAYNIHRSWRQDYIKDPKTFLQSSLLTKSWSCRICEWAVKKASAFS